MRQLCNIANLIQEQQVLTKSKHHNILKDHLDKFDRLQLMHYYSRMRLNHQVWLVNSILNQLLQMEIRISPARIFQRRLKIIMGQQAVQDMGLQFRIQQNQMARIILHFAQICLCSQFLRLYFKRMTFLNFFNFLFIIIRV